MQKKDTYTELLAKKLSGNATTEELKRLKKMQAENPAAQDFSDKAEQIWNLSKKYKDAPFVTDKKAAWQAIERKITPEPKLVKLNPLRQLLRIAAILILAVGVYWLWSNYLESSPAPTPIAMGVQSTENSTKEVTLPDGTKVTLNKNTKLTYAADFKKRSVTLVGEAFFDVVRMEDSPFEIHTGEALTRVLGTSFNVRAYPNEDLVEVNVKTGKVAFSGKTTEGKKATEILTKNEAAVYLKNKKTLSSLSEVDKNAMAWQNKTMTFSSTPFAQVESTLERYFDIEMQVKNPAILACRFEGGEFKEAQLADILTLIQISMELSITKDGDVYIVDGEGCK